MTPVAPPVAPPGSPLGSGTEASRRRPVARMIELAPVVLVVVAEAAWIAVLGGLLQEFTLRRAVLGLPVLAVFVSIGIAAARLLGPRLGDRWPIVALGIAGLGAAAGWALSEEARSAAGSGIGPAIAAHPGGIVAGLAVLRGYAHARLPLSESTVTVSCIAPLEYHAIALATRAHSASTLARGCRTVPSSQRSSSRSSTEFPTARSPAG